MFGTAAGRGTGMLSVSFFVTLKLPAMRFGVVVFPGSNCDHDAWYAVSHNLGHSAEFIWHDSVALGKVDAVILPGGFSYGVYRRCASSPRAAAWSWESVMGSRCW